MTRRLLTSAPIRTAQCFIVIAAALTAHRAVAQTTCSGSFTPCIYYQNTNTSGGYAIEGKSTHGIALQGIDTTDGYGVAGTSNSGIGTYGSSTSSTGGGFQSTYGNGVLGLTYGNGAYGVLGAANGTAASDGVHGQTSSSWSATAGENGGSGPGLYGSSATGYGVQAYSGTNNWAVAGWGEAGGVYGSSSGANSSGIYGTCTGSGCYAIYANGNVDVAGNMTVTGVFYNPSDERLKKDIEPLRGSIDKLLQLRGVSFSWKDPSTHGNNSGIQRGFIAQEYEKVFPEWVTTDKDGSKAITTTGLDALEVESIRALKEENEQLRTRIETLEAGRRPVVSNNAAWGWMTGLAMACLGMVISRRKRDASGK